MKAQCVEWTLEFYTHFLTQLFKEDFENYWAFFMTIAPN